MEEKLTALVDDLQVYVNALRPDPLSLFTNENGKARKALLLPLRAPVDKIEQTVNDFGAVL